MGISLSSTFSAAHTDTPAWALRASLLAGCAIAAGGAKWLADGAAVSSVDPALIHLLRGMALIKSMALLAAVAAVWWRLGRPARTFIVWSYLASLWSMTCATVLIWKVTLIPFAAVAFHLALFVFLFAAWRDDLRLPSRT